MSLIARAKSHPYGVLCAVTVLYAAGLLVYAQIRAFTGDEGFHLLAAQLIGSGMRPYLDFFFPQAPLNAYWNALWMGVFGQSWRVSHVISPLLTTGAVFLTADYCYRRFPEREWRLAAALAALLMTGLNSMVAAYGPLAQAYGICLLLSVAAFRIAIPAADRPAPWLSIGVGVFAGASASGSLLTAPVVPVFLLWTLLANRAGNRWIKSFAFSAGAAIPWLPVLRLAVVSPWVVWFNLVRYHTQFRVLYWPDTTEHDLDVFTSLFASGQALLLVLLAIFGVVFVKVRSGWDWSLHREIYLAGALSLALSAEAATAHPTFSRYFVFTVPFLSIAAVAGLYAIGSRVLDPSRPWWPVIVVLLIGVFGFARTLFDRRDMYRWQDYEILARKIVGITPPGGQILADDHIYFVLHRKPPAGFEFTYSHELDLPPAQETALHVVPQKEVDRQIVSGIYSTLYLCEDDEYYNKLNISRIYPHKETVEDCTLFWK